MASTNLSDHASTVADPHDIPFLSPSPNPTFALLPICPCPPVRTSSLSATERLIDQKVNLWKTEFVHIGHSHRHIPPSLNLLPNPSPVHVPLGVMSITQTREPWSGCTRNVYVHCGTSVYCTCITPPHFGACFFCTKCLEHHSFLVPFPRSPSFRLLLIAWFFRGAHDRWLHFITVLL
jgi:hypothetical protein